MGPVLPDPLPTPAVAVAVSVVLGLGLTGCERAPGDVARPAPVASAAPGPEQPTALPTYDPATTVGDYAPGFPLDLLAAPDDATVLASSARPTDDGLVEVTLNLASRRSAQQVIDDLAARLDEAGFSESEVDGATGLTAQTAFSRRSEHDGGTRVETLFVGVLDDGDRRLATISGSVAAPG